jgi:hypothetical protein
MDVLLSQLKAAKTGDEIEAAISSSSSLNLQIESEKDTLKAELERILEDGSVETTAKLRRRIKRFQQSLDVTTTRTTQPSNENLPTQIVLIKHSNPGDSIAALSICKNYHDLQREMNCLCMPNEEQGGINGEYFSEYRCPMKEVLKGLVAQAGMTNIILRRRITRLIFVLSTDAEKKEEVAAVKAKAVIAATRNLTPKAPKKEKVPYEKNIEPTIPVAVVHVMSKFEAAKHVADCISGIRLAKTPSDVEKTISALPASGFGDSVVLRELLEGILDNIELVNNSKVRRRVKRLIETLSSSSSDIVKVESESSSNPINGMYTHILYVYIYIDVHIYIYIYMCMYIYIHICIYIYIYTYLFIYTSSYTDTHIAVPSSSAAKITVDIKPKLGMFIKYLY